MVSDFRPRESYQIFLQEAVQHLQEIEQGLLTIQTEHPPKKLNSLMRAAHSIKGGAACVGLEPIQQLAYGLEKAFKKILTLKSGFDETIETLLLNAYDSLRVPLYEEIQYGKCETRLRLQELEETLVQLEEHLQACDINSANPGLFANEFQNGIERWENILHQNDAVSSHASFIAQAEIFRGLGEIANIPVLTELTRQIIEDLKANPQKSIEIGSSILASLKEACQTSDSGNPLVESPLKEAKDLKANFINETTISKANVIPIEEKKESHSSPPAPPLKAISQEEETPAILEEAEQSLTGNDTALASLSLGVRLPHHRIDLLNSLAAELITQDNQFLLHNQNQRQAVEVFDQWHRRLLNLNQSLHHWINQSALSKSKSRGKTSSGKNLEQYLSTHHSNIQNEELVHSNVKDILVTLEEELVQIGESIQDIKSIHQGFQGLLKTQQKTVKELQSNLLEARMLPIGEILSPFPRMVRDLCQTRNKSVSLEIIGSQTLVDRAIAEKIYDPLVHIVCNAFDHGIEAPEVREALGKPHSGKITIHTSLKGNQIFIEVFDDGRGLSPEKIREKLIATHHFSPEQVNQLAPYQLYDYLFKSGFTTVAKADELSGRGMGLSSVKHHVEQLKGSIQIDSTPLQGTQFTLRFPLTLSVVKLLVFNLGDSELAIPVDSLTSIVVATEKDIQHTSQGEFFQWKDKCIPIFSRQWLNQYHYLKTLSNNLPIKSQDWKKSGKTPMLILTHRDQQIAFQIDQILMEQDLVIKSFSSIISAPPILSGCTILGDGRLVAVLEASAMVDIWRQTQQSQSKHTAIPKDIQAKQPSILIIDDSLTLRDTLNITLSKAGYRVLQAREGSEGLDQLRQYEDIQCVVSDIEMPGVNGLEFLSRARQTYSAESLPIMMLTSRSSQHYRELAQKLGATGYLTKPYIDKELLSIIASLIAQKSKANVLQ